MMKMLNTLILALVAALVLIGAAAWARRTARNIKPEADTSPFYPAFKPEDVKFMRVVTYDKDKRTASPFEVAYIKGKGWVIPSKGNYPADAYDRLVKTLRPIQSLRREEIRTSRQEDHKECGVIDPEAKDDQPKEGRGQHITIRKETGGDVLADYIISNQYAEGQPGYKFVRIPDEKAVYRVKVSLDMSTRFSDWIVTNLLGIGPSANVINRMVIEEYDFDDFGQERVPYQNRKRHVLTRIPNQNWALGDATPDEDTNQDMSATMASALQSLEIIDVRKAPDFKNAQARIGEGIKIGFFPEVDPRTMQVVNIRSKEGELLFETDEGIEYRLLFGQIAASGESKTGAAGSAARIKDRYLMVRVNVADSLRDSEPKPPPAAAPVPPPPPPPAPIPGAAPKDGEKKEAAPPPPPPPAPNPAALAAEYQAKHKEWSDKLDKAIKRQAELHERFRDWYYVISGESFDRLHVKRDVLVRPKPIVAADLPGEKVPQDTPPTFIEGGVQYFDIEKGAGPALKDGDTVVVHYTGWLYKDRKQFDSTRDRNKPAEFVLVRKGEQKGTPDEMIKGLNEAVRTMCVGGRRKVVIPPEAGYGDPGAPKYGIPPKAKLVYDIEVRNVKSKP
jgi:hypothetical protein